VISIRSSVSKSLPASKLSISTISPQNGKLARRLTVVFFNRRAEMSGIDFKRLGT